MERHPLTYLLVFALSVLMIALPVSADATGGSGSDSSTDSTSTELPYSPDSLIVVDPVTIETGAPDNLGNVVEEARFSYLTPSQAWIQVSLRLELDAAGQPFAAHARYTDLVTGEVYLDATRHAEGRAYGGIQRAAHDLSLADQQSFGLIFANAQIVDDMEPITRDACKWLGFCFVISLIAIFTPISPHGILGFAICGHGLKHSC